MKKPHVPAIPTTSITMAIKALAAGNANENQQKMAINWIINELCGTYDLSYTPEGDRETAFAEGKRFVGLRLVREVNIKLNRSKEDAVK